MIIFNTAMPLTEIAFLNLVELQSLIFANTTEINPEMVEPKTPDGINQSSPLAANQAQPPISDNTTKGKGRSAKRGHY